MEAAGEQTAPKERKYDGANCKGNSEGPETETRSAPSRKRPKNPVDHWSPAVLLERAAYLRKMAKHGDGSASETLKEFPQHCAMLSFRSRSGEAEVHERFADLFVC